MTVSDDDAMEDKDGELVNSDIKRAHPTVLHLVRKNKSNRRVSECECIPSAQHWCIKFLILGDKLIVINHVGKEDEGRSVYNKATDEMFNLDKIKQGDCV